jgi:hypothetical protein
MADNIFLGTGTDPTDWADITNWSLGVIPVNGDRVFFNHLSAPVFVTQNLDQSAVSLLALYITSGFEGGIGDSTTFLQIGATSIVEIGSGEGNGSQTLNIDTGAVATTIDVLSVPTTGADTNFAPCRIKANNAGTNVQINGETSNVSILDEDDATGTVGNIDIIQASNVELGRGLTYSNLSQLNGVTEVLETQGTNVVADGEIIFRGSSAVTQIVQTGGDVVSNTLGTIADYVGRGGTLDLTQSALARTITQLTRSPDFTYNYHTNVSIGSELLDSDFETFEISIT